VLVSAGDEANLFEERFVVQAIEKTRYSGVEVFVPDSLLTSASAKMQELGIPDARQLSEN
jgi:hypothetical protein